MESFKVREIPKLIAAVLIVFFSGAIGTLATLPEITTWYVTLAKPTWTPPNDLFGPIWSSLYILIGIALFLVWREGLYRRDVKFAILNIRSAAGTECIMVFGVFWPPLHTGWIHTDLFVVDSYTGQYNRILCHIQTSRALTHPIFNMG